MNYCSPKLYHINQSNYISSCGDGSSASGAGNSDTSWSHCCADGSSVSGGTSWNFCLDGDTGDWPDGCQFGSVEKNNDNCGNGFENESQYFKSTCESGAGQGKENPCFTGSFPQT